MTSTTSRSTGGDNDINTQKKKKKKTNKLLVDYIYSHFIKGGSVQKGSNPGFAHAMKLSYQTIDKNRFSVEGPSNNTSNPNCLSYRYRLSKDVPKWTVGLLTALMDELSTDACFRVGLPCPPGVSLQMQTELVDGTTSLTTEEEDHEEEMDVVNIVTKLGKTVSHTRTEFRWATSQKLVAFSSHVKYMPTGSRILDVVFKSRFLYDFLERWYLRKLKLPWYDEQPLFESVLQSHIEFHGLVDGSGRATFHMTREHTNPHGALHGGCHAMIMEYVAESFAKAELVSNYKKKGAVVVNVVLQAMQIEFLSAAKGSINVLCETINSSDNDSSAVSSSGTLQVRVLLKRGERTCSEGKLRFSAVSIYSRL
jgi:acyl-coenzyme A thioesterase PaaI-like protein